MEPMNMRLVTGTLSLQRSGLLRLDGARGAAILCRKGRLWITQEGDDRDTFVGPDERYWIGSDGTTLIEALEPAQLSIEAPRTGVLPAPVTA